MRSLLLILTCFASLNLQSEDLYTFIKPMLETFTRPFTVFDFDSENPETLLQIAKDFPQATCIIAGTNSNTLIQAVETCKQEPNLTNLIVLTEPLTITDLKNLASVEHFDIALLGSPEPSKSLIFVTKILASKIVTSALTIMNGNKNVKVKPHWFSSEKASIPLNLNERGQSITVTPQGLLWSYDVTRAPGISVVTFLALKGAVPEIATLEKTSTDICWHQYKNVAPWEIYITGSNIEFAPLSEKPQDLEITKKFFLSLLRADPTALKNLVING
jgi:hypothetical protein